MTFWAFAFCSPLCSFKKFHPPSQLWLKLKKNKKQSFPTQTEENVPHFKTFFCHLRLLRCGREIFVLRWQDKKETFKERNEGVWETKKTDGQADRETEREREASHIEMFRWIIVGWKCQQACCQLPLSCCWQAEEGSVCLPTAEHLTGKIWVVKKKKRSSYP